MISLITRWMSCNHHGIWFCLQLPEERKICNSTALITNWPRPSIAVRLPKGSEREKLSAVSLWKRDHLAL